MPPGGSSLPLTVYLVIALLIGYIISPYDFVSESQFGIYGVIDDAFVMSVLVAFLLRALDPLTTLWIIYVCAWSTLASWIAFICPLYAGCCVS
jgi:hypothetical protein